MFPGVTGQEVPRKILQRALCLNRLPASLLFTGPRGVGKETMAFAVAKALLCPNSAGTGSYCGECGDCLRIDRVQSPDVRYYAPMPSIRKDTSAAMRGKIQIEAREKLEEKLSRKAFLPGYEEKEAIHSIHTIRADLLKFMELSSFSSRVKIVIVRDIDRMKAETANTFLKTLEEPPADSYIICTVESGAYHSLLPTIRSRCTVIKFRKWTPGEIETYLSEEIGIEDMELLRSASNMSDGSIVRAREMAENTDKKAREIAAALIDAGGFQELLRRIDKLRIGQKKNLARDILSWGLSFHRDRLAELLGGKRIFPGTGMPEALASCNNSVVLGEAIENLENKMTLISRNIFLPLLLTGAFCHGVINEKKRRS